MSSRKLAIVCGGRTFNDLARMREVVKAYAPTFVIEGKAAGADHQAGLVCAEMGIDYVEVPALWDVYGLSAGYRRNSIMLKMLLTLAGDNDKAVIAMPGGKGTLMMVNLAEGAGVQVIHG